MANEKIILGALSGCKSKTEIEKVFSMMKISDIQKKIDMLDKCMGNPVTYYSTGANIPIDKRYEVTAGIFLQGDWKLVLGL